MTVLTTSSRETKLGNGVTTSFPFSIVFLDNSDIVVTHVPAAGVAIPWTLGSQYTLTGVGGPTGGTLTTTAGNTVATGAKLVIDRQTPATQLVDLVPNSPLPADTLERSLDKLTHLAQGLVTTDTRALRLAADDPASALNTLPLKTALASKFLAFDGNGDPIAAAGTSANLGPVSSFINTLLDDVNAAAARATLGINGLFFDVRDYGAVGTGAVDDTAAIQAAIDAAEASVGGVVFIPRGVYAISAALTIQDSGIWIMGEGQTATVIRPTVNNINGFSFGPSIDFVGIRDLTIEPAVTMIAGAAIVTTGAVNIFSIERVRILGGYRGIVLAGAGLVHRIDNVYIQDLSDTCITVGNPGVSNFMQDVFISRVNTSGGTNSLLALNVSGLYVSQCDFVLATDGVVFNPGAGDVAIFCFFQQVLADTCGDNGWHATTTGGGVTANISCNGCWSAGATNQGILIDSTAVDGFAFIGGQIRNSGKNGVLIQAGENIVIAGNQIYHNSLDGSGLYHGISVADGVPNFIIKDNIIGQGGYDYQAGGTNLQGYGIFLASSAANTTRFVIAGNTLYGNTLAGMLDGTATGNKRIYGNIGYVGVNSGSATVPIGNSAVLVNHGLQGTPNIADIRITAVSSPAASSVPQYFVTTPTSTTFTINTTAVVAGANLVFGWSAHLPGNS